MINYLIMSALFLSAPLIGIIVAFNTVNPYYSAQTFSFVNEEENVQRVEQVESNAKEVAEQTTALKQMMPPILTLAKGKEKDLQNQQIQLERLVGVTKQQTKVSDIILEKVLSKLLGEPKHTHNGKHSTVKIYSLTGAGYRGYMAKVKPHTTDALKLVLANDEVVSNGETPSHAAQRNGALLAVNAGGFWKTPDGKLAPLGITVVNGEIKTFYKNEKLSFVGFNTSGHLVGGKVNTSEELKKLDVLQGSSFVPTLLKDGKKQHIPKEWANTKHPRTIVGNFSNGELLFIVVDGRREGWSSGITLEEIQNKLISFKIKDAFNLDGGGSSAFYYNGKILNKPSDGNQRRVTSSIIILP